MSIPTRRNTAAPSVFAPEFRHDGRAVGCGAGSGIASLKYLVQDFGDAYASHNTAALLNVNLSPDPKARRINFRCYKRDSAVNSLSRHQRLAANIMMFATGEIIVAQLVLWPIARKCGTVPSSLFGRKQSNLGFNIWSTHTMPNR
jgi:hypothetical protein